MTKRLPNLAVMLAMSMLLGNAMYNYAEAAEPTLSEIIHDARYPRKKVEFHPPSNPQFETLRVAAKNIEKYGDACDPEAARRINDVLKPAAMELLTITRGKTTFWIIREKAPVFRGGGIYIRRCGAQTVPLVLQAPHGYFDLHTGRLARQLFRDTGARWVMLNSLQRYKSRKGETPADAYHPADAAHNNRLFFQAVTKGILEASPTLLFAQLHGYEERGHDEDVILSDGRRSPQIWSNMLKKAWNPKGMQVVVYGASGKGLGGTTNVQGNLINAAEGRFIHIEMAKPVRETMKKVDRIRKAFGQALVDVARRSK